MITLRVLVESMNLPIPVPIPIPIQTCTIFGVYPQPRVYRVDKRCRPYWSRRVVALHILSDLHRGDEEARVCFHRDVLSISEELWDLIVLGEQDATGYRRK